MRLVLQDGQTARPLQEKGQKRAYKAKNRPICGAVCRFFNGLAWSDPCRGGWERIHVPLIASCAETGDLLAPLLRDGNAAPGPG